MTLFNRQHITSYSQSFPRYYHSVSIQYCLWPWTAIQVGYNS